MSYFATIAKQKLILWSCLVSLLVWRESAAPCHQISWKSFSLLNPVYIQTNDQKPNLIGGSTNGMQCNNWCWQSSVRLLVKQWFDLVMSVLIAKCHHCDITYKTNYCFRKFSGRWHFMTEWPLTTLTCLLWFNEKASCQCAWLMWRFPQAYPWQGNGLLWLAAVRLLVHQCMTSCSGIMPLLPPATPKLLTWQLR